MIWGTNCGLEEACLGTQANTLPLPIFAFITHHCQWAAWLAFPKRSNTFSQRSLNVFLGSCETFKGCYFTYIHFFFFLIAICPSAVLELFVSSSCMQEGHQARSNFLHFSPRHRVKQTQNWRSTAVCAASTAKWEKGHRLHATQKVSNAYKT